MTSKVVSFQVVQGVEGETKIFYSFVIALCEDGSLWRRLFVHGDSEQGWQRLTPELAVKTEAGVWVPTT